MFVILGIAIIAIVPLLYLFLEEPGTAGGSRNLFKYMKAKRATRQQVSHDQAPSELEGMTFKQIAKDRVFWLILLATLIAGAPRGGLFTYLSPILSSRGFNGQAETANYLTLITATGALGSLIGGLALDKYHSTKLAVPFKLMAVAALVLLGIVTSSFGGLSLLAVSAVFWGVSQGAMAPMATYFNTRLFGLKAFGGMMGLNSFFFAIFLGIIAPVVGESQELTGSYQPALWVTQWISCSRRGDLSDPRPLSLWRDDRRNEEESLRAVHSPAWGALGAAACRLPLNLSRTHRHIDS